MRGTREAAGARHGHRPAQSGDWVVFLPSDGGAPALLDPAHPEGLSPGRHDGLFVFCDGQPEHADFHRPGAALARRWLESGDAVLAGHRGAFTLIAFDTQRSLGLALRDPLGACPLFYATVRGGVLLAGNIESLLAHAAVPRTPNRAALADHLSQRWPDNGETYYAAVRRVPPGHALSIAGRTLRVARYFRLAEPSDAEPWVDEGQSSRLNELLEDAVARATGGDRAGIFLSGGIDSVTVAAIAADRSRTQGLPAPLALSLVFPDDDCNEEFVQRRVARRLGLAQTIRGLESAIGGGTMLNAALELAAGWPAPLLNVWLPAYLQLARDARARGCAAVLTGGGGDEWLNVSPYLAADLLLQGDVAGIYRLWRAAARSTHFSAWRFAARIPWRFGLRPHASTLAARILGAAAPDRLRAWRRLRIDRATPPWVAPDPSLRRELGVRGEAVSPLPEGPFGYYFRDMRTGLDHALTSMEMEEWDEVRRRAGVRIAQPFWDAGVVDLLHRVDPRALMQGGRSKGLVRSALERRFPGLGFGAQKKVLSSDFFGAVLHTGAPAALDAIGGLDSLADLGVIDAPAAERFLRDVVARNDRRNIHHIWSILGLEVWTRHHF